jgi:hypothetical protein
MEIRQAISMYLTAKAYNDTEFKNKFENPAKNLDECVTYVTLQVYNKVKEQAEKNRQSMAVAIPSDDEVFAYAEQYYINEDLKVDGSALDDMRIVSASATTFTDEEKAQMRQEAIKKYQDSVIEEQKKKDRERKEKAKKAKEKKPAAPVLVPDTPANKSEEPTKSNKAEGKAKAIQMNLFDI